MTSPTFPLDGLCPFCRSSFNDVYRDLHLQVIWPAQFGKTAFQDAVTAISTHEERVYFWPCGHDASSCFPDASHSVE